MCELFPTSLSRIGLVYFKAQTIEVDALEVVEHFVGVLALEGHIASAEGLSTLVEVHSHSVESVRLEQLLKLPVPYLQT